MFSSATLFIDDVTCKDEIGNWLAEKAGNDEIWLGAIGIGADRGLRRVPFSEVYAHFDDGDVKRFSPPRPLVTLPTDGDPARCGSLLMLAEQQHGGMDRALDRAAQAMAARLGAHDPQGPGIWDILPPIDPTEFLPDVVKDKLFPPQSVRLHPESGLVDFRAHGGHYQLRYHWTVS